MSEDTTVFAAAVVHPGVDSVLYVSGDAISTAYAFARQGVPSARIRGDSCTCITWENATRTADWLCHHNPGSPSAADH